jgi:hypothetical protein
MPLANLVNGRDLGRVGTTDTIKWTTEVPIGASGATGTLLRGPNGIAVAKNGTGVYDVTVMPITPAGKGRFRFGLYSPLLTVTEATVTAYDGAAGTMTFTTSKGGTAAEPASGDKVWVYYEGEPR